VERFSPYRRVQDENPGARGAVREMIRTAREQNRRAYIFVNNRLEGNAPQTIEAILEDD
jgi:translation elongation factor EF-Tu-like GTPase